MSFSLNRRIKGLLPSSEETSWAGQLDFSFVLFLKLYVLLFYTEDIVLNTRRVTQDEHSEEEEEAGLVEDDDVPEAMSFSSGRETALHQMKTALQQIGRNKEKMKEKRRQINEQNKLQKVKIEISWKQYKKYYFLQIAAVIYQFQRW